MFIKYLGFCCLKHTSSSQRQYPTVIEELRHKFSLVKLRKSTNNFDENRILGSGSIGTVYKGSLQLDGATDDRVAIKQIDVSNNQNLKEFKNEIEMLCQLRHPNLVSLLGFCDHKDEKYVVYEYMANGSLHDHLYCGDVKREPLTWKQRLKICIGAAHGLHYLHTGTHGYVAPEISQNNTLTDKCDVYSFGVVLLEVVCTDKLKFVEKRQRHPVEVNIDPNLKGNIAPECWEVFVDITERCLNYDPNERPTMGEVEVQLELALSLQEEADIRNTCDDYTLLSMTIIN
ncbi:receptor-like protein kinase ANXUR2 isoform X2 [Abrus precatorius]|uniref:Receptor-like protein kinase ANXUR2 isoform X2 n=1 Tax=Abrus precatorius TaxID=3816 RepID=A0A8B8L5W0_ABRPR|nr:receptor-like protein kinase ANXUR2 isoform X2 [Abrus precatorius]